MIQPLITTFFKEKPKVFKDWAKFLYSDQIILYFSLPCSKILLFQSKFIVQCSLIWQFNPFFSNDILYTVFYIFGLSSLILLSLTMFLDLTFPYHVPWYYFPLPCSLILLSLTMLLDITFPFHVPWSYFPLPCFLLLLSLTMLFVSVFIYHVPGSFYPKPCSLILLSLTMFLDLTRVGHSVLFCSVRYILFRS